MRNNKQKQRFGPMIGGLIGLLILVAAIWWIHGASAVNKQDRTQKIFTVQKGAATRTIANNLKQNGLVNDPVIFFLILKSHGYDRRIQAGDFRLSPSMSAEQIGEALTHGALDIWVTIPEGKRADEIADLLKAKIPSYQESWRQILVSEEGTLFPDTYLIPRDATINLISHTMTQNFEQKYESLGTNSTGYSKEDIIKLASVIEREGKTPSDMGLIASVLYNRLKAGMSLDVDATVQYALGYQPAEQSWWKKTLTIQDLQIDSPYNTYKNTGLPPTPIANPGANALEAALTPASSDYLFYITDKHGVFHFAKTLNEQNANIAKYGV